MTWWVTVAAVRIHGWIQQTPKLSHMRGASQALSLRTSPATVEKLSGFPEVMVRTRESEVDGVVVASAPDLETAGAYARHLVSHLAHEIPGVQWESWWCEADSYVKAFSRAVDDFDTGVHRLRRFPALLEAGPVMSCLMCRSEPASRGGDAAKAVVGDDDVQALTTQGKGCNVRHNEGTVNKAALPPDDLRSRIPGDKLAKDFADLARYGGVTPSSSRGALGRKESRSHLATVYADGNGMGAFFQALSSTSLAVPRLQQGAISELNKATKSAVVDAAAAVASDPSTAAIEPHLVGGDDVLVSVPAPCAWVFAARLASSFEGLRKILHTLLDQDLGPQQADREVPEVQLLRDRIDAISLGVGITFAHASYPFAEAEESASAAMKQAKQAAKGQRSGIGWVDVTAQFAARGHQRAYVVTASEVQKELLIPVDGSGARPAFRLTPSGRSQLGAILRDESESTLYETVRAWAKRLEDGDIREGLVGRADARAKWEKLDSPAQATTSIEKIWADMLRADLSRARWWPNVSREVER